MTYNFIIEFLLPGIWNTPEFQLIAFCVIAVAYAFIEYLKDTLSQSSKLGKRIVQTLRGLLLLLGVIIIVWNQVDSYTTSEKLNQVNQKVDQLLPELNKSAEKMEAINTASATLQKKLDSVNKLTDSTLKASNYLLKTNKRLTTVTSKIEEQQQQRLQIEKPYISILGAESRINIGSDTTKPRIRIVLVNKGRRASKFSCYFNHLIYNVAKKEICGINGHYTNANASFVLEERGTHIMPSYFEIPEERSNHTLSLVEIHWSYYDEILDHPTDTSAYLFTDFKNQESPIYSLSAQSEDIVKMAKILFSIAHENDIFKSDDLDFYENKSLKVF